MELDINSIELDRDNPRIKMYLEMYGGNVTAQGIALALNSSSSDGATSFTSLKESIRVNGGIINPIIVNHTADDRYVVIEGNTRLQIYREFAENTENGNWNVIRAIVYENLSEEEMHSIRLQSHLVGPREWDPYSKAKYLHYLYHEAKLPMATIISYCGGKNNEVLKLIASYKDMQKYYVPLVNEKGYDMDIREFSKFSELQNRSIKEALALHHYELTEFAKWVVEGNIDKAQNVRQLPQVLKEEAAKKEFFKTNLTNAIKKLNSDVQGTVDLSSLGYEELGGAFLRQIRNITWQEEGSLKKRETQEYEDKLNLLIDIASDLTALLKEVQED